MGHISSTPLKVGEVSLAPRSEQLYSEIVNSIAGKGSTIEEGYMTTFKPENLRRSPNVFPTTKAKIKNP